MKKLILYLIVSFLVLTNYGQSLTNDTISVRFLNASLLEFISAIENDTKFTFVYKQQWVSENKITVNITNGSVKEILEQAFKYSDLTYTIVEPNLIVLVTKETFVNEIPAYNYNGNLHAEINDENADLAVQNRYLKGRQTDEKKVIVVGTKAGISNGRKAVVSAKLLDIENREPLIGATLYIEETKNGAAANENGELSLSLFPGKYSAEFSSIGMAHYKCVLDVKSDGFFTIEMKREVRSLEEVTVSGKQNYKIRGNEVGLDRIAIKSIKELPTLMGEKDILKVSQMLPGIVSVSEASSGVNVRGGSVDQNMFYINNIPLYNTSHLFGFFSSINSAIIKDFSIYKGYVPVQFGGRLSSVFDVETRNGNKNKFFAQGGVSPISANVSAEGPIVKGKSSFVVSGRSSYSDWILNRLPQGDLKNSNASFYDLSASVDYELNKNNHLSIFNYYSSDYFNFNQLNEYDYSNFGSGLNFFHRFSPRVKSNLSVVYADYRFASKDKNNETQAYAHDFSLSHTEAKADVAWLINEKHSVTAGASALLYSLDRGIINPYGTESSRSVNELGKEKALESALFIYDNYNITKKLNVNVGVRYSMFNYLGAQDVYTYDNSLPKRTSFITDTLSFGSGETVSSFGSPELRASLDYKINQFSSVKVAYNEMHQYLFLLSNTYSVAPTDQWKLSDYHIKPANSKQISAGYYQNVISQGMSVSGELYYKWSDNVLEFKDGADFIETKEVETMTLQGQQKAYGFEFMLARDEGKLNGWASYAYSRSFMHFDGEKSWDQINDGMEYPSNYDKPHVFNLVCNYRHNRRLILSSNLVYSTGRPITLPQSVYPMDGMQFVDYSARNEFRIPDYFRMDLSLTIEGNLKANKPFHSYWMVNVYNLTGRKNPYSIYFVSEGDQINGYKYSVIGVPIFTISWNVKLGNYAND